MTIEFESMQDDDKLQNKEMIHMQQFSKQATSKEQMKILSLARKLKISLLKQRDICLCPVCIKHISSKNAGPQRRS